MRTELHLDSDEWETILLTLKLEHEKSDGDYRSWLDAIILKIECVLLEPQNLQDSAAVQLRLDAYTDDELRAWLESFLEIYWIRKPIKIWWSVA